MNQQTLRTYKEVKAYSVRSFEKEVAICRRLNCCLDPSRHRIDVNGPEIVPVTESTITYNNGLYTQLIKVQQRLVWRTVLKRAIWLASYVKSVCYWRCRCPPTFFTSHLLDFVMNLDLVIQSAQYQQLSCSYYYGHLVFARITVNKSNYIIRWTK